MEPELVRKERRGRKRRRKDVENVGEEDQQAKKTRLQVLVGRYVKKEFEGSGVFLGKVVYYDTGLYRIDYEDGDCEDLESGEVREFLMKDEDFDKRFMLKKRKLDGLVSRKYAKGMPGGKEVEAEKADAGMGDKVEVGSLSGVKEVEGDQVDDDDYGDDDVDSSGDSCVSARDLSSEVEIPLIPPPELPPSSASIGVPEECVSYLLSVYSFLRSFSIRLFLSPFGLDDFVGSLNCSVPNTLLDAIHVALMGTLRRHFETLSSDVSELASKCLRCMDWSLLDTLTWPVFLVQYLMIMGYTEGPEWKGFCINALERDYYTLSACRKLMVLQILCDDCLESAELRAEIDMREESEVGIDSDGVTVVAPQSGPRRVHPRYAKTSACKDQEAMGISAESQGTKLSSNSSSLGFGSTGPDAGGDVDQDGNGDECRLCGMDGTLLCCDGCPSAYHSRCIGVIKMYIPGGAWYCPECTIDKVGPTITKGTSLKGAEMFGVDSYEQVFLATCNHLLVLKVSINSELCIRYYNQNDIPRVLRALYSSQQHIAMYTEICKGIVQYWEIPEDAFSLSETVELGLELTNKQEDGECFPQSLPQSGKTMVEGENFASTESSSENVAGSCHEDICKEPGLGKVSLDKITHPDPSGVQRSDDAAKIEVCSLKTVELSEQIKVESAMSAGSVSMLAVPSDLTQQSLVDKSNLIENAPCTSGNSNSRPREYVNGTCVAANMSYQSKEGTTSVVGRAARNIADVCLYMGSSFKSQTYINQYSNGDFAASAAANLAILSSEETRVSETQASTNYRKVMSANFELQVKAFSSTSVCFSWPNSDKKLVEVPRERCGWCLSCKSAVTCKRGCLLNLAVLNAKGAMFDKKDAKGTMSDKKIAKGAMKIPSSTCPVQNGDGSLLGIATYVMFMEESLCGLTVGPFKSSTYRKQWSKLVEQTTTCSALKTLLLELEENIQAVAFSVEWVRLVDNRPVETSVTQSTSSVVGSTQRRGRRSRKLSEVTTDDDKEISIGFNWYRGGMLSKLIFQKGTLPHSMVKKAARQGGSRKIPGIHYPEGFEIPQRSRQLVWRSAVEMSKNASQLGLQVRYLDLHVRWSELVRPKSTSYDGKGPETEASAFRNASISDKKVVENKIRYCVAFGNQKHLSSRVMKSVSEVEKSEDGKEKYWFLETRIPLYLIKEYGGKLQKVPLPSTEDPGNLFSKIRKRQLLRCYRKNIFSYLSLKRDNLHRSPCASCHLDVLVWNAFKCSSCQGYCHEQCTVSSTVHLSEEVEFLITCKQCHNAKAITPIMNNNESPTSPLLLQGQELQKSVAVTVSEGRRQNSRRRPSAHVAKLEERSSSDMKPTTNGSRSTPRERRKICSWGLIWKKNSNKGNGVDETVIDESGIDDPAIDFRLRNVLLKDSPDHYLLKPICHLCQKSDNSDLMYIRCETCTNWYHAEALELEESSLFKLAGFKCCRCRRIRSPVCPYMDEDKKKKAEAKKPNRRVAKKANSEMVQIDPDSDSISERQSRVSKKEHLEMFQNDFDSDSISEHPEEWMPDSPVLPVKEEVVFAQDKDDHGLIPYSGFEQVNEHTTAMSMPVPKKLPVRRQMKQDRDLGGSPIDNNPTPFDSSTPLLGDTSNPAEELSFPIEWDNSTNGFEDGMMFNIDALDIEDMEFEPQTYFSFTELLESDDGVQLDGVDLSGDIMANWEDSSALLQDNNLEQYGMGIINSDQQEQPTTSAEAGVDLVPCCVCSRTQPYPDLSCQVCGCWIHSQCSMWDEEEGSREGGWSCVKCRDWR